MNNKMTPSSNTPEKIKKYFEDKDWKFYCALLAGLTLAGTGAYYLTRPSSSSTPKKKGTSKKESKSKKTTEKEPEVTTKQAEVTSNTSTTTTTTTTTTETIDYTTLSDEAIAELTTEQRNKTAQSLKEKGNKLFGAKKYEQAVEAYTEAIRFKADPIFYSNRAACYSFLGQHDRVIEDTNEALKLDPEYVKAINRRAQAYEKENRLNDALYDFTSVCILDGFKNDNAAKSMERLLKQLASTRAKEIMQAKKHRLPSTTYVSAYLDSFRPANIELPTTTDESSGDFHFAKAYRAALAKDYPTALEASEKAIELGCSAAYLPAALNLKGTFVFLKGDTQGALECLNKAIELDPKYVQSYIKRSSIYIEQQDIASAFKEFEDAIAINPSDPDAYYHRGQIHYISNNYDLAAKDYSESIRLDDSFLYAHVQLGVVQYKMGSVSSSMTTFKNTLKQFPESSDVHNYYGELLADQQKFPEAIDMFSKAIELDPKNPLPYINKAMLKFQLMAEADEAVSLCKKALEGKVFHSKKENIYITNTFGNLYIS
ncbi:uncharacterized protein BX664DRAFT_112005 [Halteromyces radiatus]|uniref:uncharacterized protein n=1 Tax=Halteromyces radiatus TaxID=101107 RepID=UPI00221F5C18|nr:uncharacterized protein BX664DRAFT_112005 [Halteromyces radiatus]KAI8093661.1 hypothetical protein BX664DRAFT_112005 [Halteromyces radiatus]